MLLMLLKIVAGLAVLGIICLVMVAVISGIRASAGSLRGGDEQDKH